MKTSSNILFFDIHKAKRFIKNYNYIQKRSFGLLKSGQSVFNKLIASAPPKMPLRPYSCPAVYNNNVQNIIESDKGSQTGIYHKHLIEFICDLPGCSHRVCPVPCSTILYAIQKGVFTSSPETAGNPNIYLGYKNIAGQYKSQYFNVSDKPIQISYPTYDELKKNKMIEPDHAGDNYVQKGARAKDIHEATKPTK